MEGRFKSTQERRYEESYAKVYDAKRDVFRNKLGITDQDELGEREAYIANIRSASRPKLDNFSSEEIRGVHAHLFSKIYDWAGQLREYPTGRSAAPFALPERIDGALKQLTDDLKKENYLQGLDKDMFAERVGHYASEFNAIHPFIEGNGRMTRILVEDLSAKAGHDFDPRVIRRDKAAWYEAAELSFRTGDATPVARLVETSLRRPPTLDLVAGPNGSGKSTFIKRNLSNIPLVNADNIAKTLDMLAGSERDYKAMEMAAQERAERIANGKSFVAETVFSHASKLELLNQAKAAGFMTRLTFVATDNPQINVQRVAQRVMKGGHDVPTEKILARYERSLTNLNASLPIADYVEVYDNTNLGKTQKMIAEFKEGQLVSLEPNLPQWAQRVLGPQIADYMLVQGKEATVGLSDLGYAAVAKSGRFSNVRTLDGGATFPLEDKTGKVVGIERNSQRVGQREAVYKSQQTDRDVRLVITQTPLDALAHAELNKTSLKTSRYIAVNDLDAQADVAQEAIKNIKERDGKVVVAVSKTPAGEQFTQRIKALAQKEGLNITLKVPPSGKTFTEAFNIRLLSLGRNKGLER